MIVGTTRIYARLVMVAVLVALVGIVDAQRVTYPWPDRLDEIIGDGLPITPGGDRLGGEGFRALDRCMLHGLSIPGQGLYISGSGLYISGSGLYISGSVGGLVLGLPLRFDPKEEGLATVQVPTPSLPDVLNAPASPDGRNLIGTLFEVAQHNTGESVVLVVADDFGSDNFDVPAVVGALPRLGSSSTAHLEDETEILKRLVITRRLTHGALVLRHLVQAIDLIDLYQRVPYQEDPFAPGVWNPLSSDAAIGRFVWTNQATGQFLIVQGLNVVESAFGSEPGRADTTEIAQKLAKGIEALHNELSVLAPIGGYVINMSWVLLPCPTVEWFLENIASFPSLDTYVQALKDADPGIADIYGEEFFDKFIEVLSMVGDSDPLFQFIHNPLQGMDTVSVIDRIAFVAASGNFYRDYQMAPADWPYVVGVGVPEGGGAPRYTNWANLVVPSSWFRFAGQPGGELAYAGTSYNAPLVSLLLAVDLAAQKGCTPPLVTLPQDPDTLAKVPAGNWTWAVEAFWAKCGY